MRASPGQCALFIQAACIYEGTQCLLWPYGRADSYGALFHRGRKVYAHRLVCELVHGKPPRSKRWAAHACGIRLCVSPQHLRWATASENEADKLLHGRHNRGGRNGFAKLTEAAVRAIRAQPYRPLTELATEYGVSKQTACKARWHQTWTWLETE
jgi:hypothetical protein